MYEAFRKSYLVSHFVFKNYVDLTIEEASEVLRCRNDIAVRKWMTSTEEIPLENHLKFIEGLKNSERNFYWAVYQDDKFQGGISLTGMDDFSANSGIFLNPQLIGNGLGMQISICSVDFYFLCQNMKSIYSVVQKDNINAIKLNKFLGCTFYEKEGDFIPIDLKRDVWMEKRSKLLKMALGKNVEKVEVKPVSFVL